MSRLCEACRHSQRQEIDVALLLHTASYDRIAARFGLSFSGVRRHERHCLGRSYALAEELKAMLSAENLLDQLGKWHERMEEQYQNADATGNISAAVATARTGIAAIESFAKLGPMVEFEQRLAALEEETRKGISSDDLPAAG
jgi:hypothetical protein